MHEDLVARCLQGDDTAYGKLYSLYSKTMYNTCYRILGDEDRAADALQEGFISAFRNLASYRGESTFGAWLKRIVVNKAINEKNKKQWESLDEDEELEIEDELDQNVYDELTVERVRDAIESLPDGYRLVVSLYLLEGYDHQEIAEILNITTSTSKSQLNRAKNRLRELLQSNYERKEKA